MLKSKMNKSLVISLILLGLFLTPIGSIASAAQLTTSNHLSPMDVAVLSSSSDKQVSTQQINEAKTISNNQQKEAEIALDKKVVALSPTVLAAAASKSWSSYTGIDKSNGGSAIGFSQSTWDSFTNTNFNGSRAEVGGSYWAKGWGWNYFTPSATGNYDINVKYYLTGRVLGGNLLTKIRVKDTKTGTTYESNCLSSSSGYYSNSSQSNTKTFYLTQGHEYCIIFEADTDATAIASATMSDFCSKEFDGTQRKIKFSSMSVTKR